MIELNECFYCHTNLMPSGLMIPIGTLNVSDLYLLCDQKNTGRCIVAYNKCHVRELFELSADDRIAFIEDICRVSAVLKELFSAKKINYGIFGDTVPHLHAHIVPKKPEEADWGDFFTNRPPKKILTEGEYRDLVDKIRTALGL